MRVLIAEDDVRLGHALRRGLEEADFSVDISWSGDDGDHFAASTVDDLISVSAMLPSNDGFAVSY